MISDPKLPFDSPPASVEIRTGVSAEVSPGNTGTSEEAKVVSRRGPSVAQVWLRRVGVLLFVFLCATIGVMLMIVPWRPEWADNPLLLRYPTLRDLVGSGFMRGVVTGLGLVNVWIGFWEALRYREED
jgi:hypothetical protein